MTDPFGTPPRTSATPTTSASNPTIDHDDDLLDCLLNYHTDNDGHHDDGLYDKLEAMFIRYERDLGDGLWGLLVERCSGFKVDIHASNTPSTSTATGDGMAIPSIFESSEGKLHLDALTDQLNISKERAVQLTFGTLASLMEDAHLINTRSPTSNDGFSSPTDSNSPANEGDEEEEARTAFLLSHLGTRSLFDRCIYKYRHQFLERLRILLECLRMDQDERVATDDDEGGNGGSKSGSKGEVSKFLDWIDSRVTINDHKRGLFQFLLKLAVSPLPDGFKGQVCYLATLLSGSSRNDDGLIAISIRKEVIEALLVLLYDRMEGGVQRLDLFMLVEGATLAQSANSDGSGGGLEYLEFAMDSSAYIQSGTIRNRIDTRKLKSFANDDLFASNTIRESILLSVEKLRCDLNGLWALLCAECMGLWRANSEGWITDHPLFMGLNLTNMGDLEQEAINSVTDTPQLGLTGRNLGLTLNDENDVSRQAQKEFELLQNKLVSLGETLRDRRKVAYKSNTRLLNDMDPDSEQQHEDDDELWGIQAPEGVALLSFGLLLQLVRLNSNSEDDEFVVKLTNWGQDCVGMANEDCAAFAYLELVLDGVVVDPLDGAQNRLSRRLGTGVGEGAKIVAVLAGRKEISMLADNDSMALMAADRTNDKEQEIIAAVDASSVIYSSIGREILSATVRVFQQSLKSLQSSSTVENISMLVDLAAITYHHLPPLCEQFWSDWNDSNSRMTDGEAQLPLSSDESMAFLLETALHVATSTLAELTNGGRQEAIVKYLRPMSAYLHLISSLCIDSNAVQGVLSALVPDGLISKTLALCHTLAPMASSLNESSEPVTPDDRRTIKHATIALESIAKIAYLGGQAVREFLRSPSESIQPRVLFSIASEAMPNRNGTVFQECVYLALSALNLLSELLVGSSVSFQMETSECFAPGIAFAVDANSVFSLFFRGGIQSEMTLSAMSVLNRLAVSLEHNSFDINVNLTSICTHMETLRDGVKAGFDVISSLFSSGEVLPLTSQIEVEVAYSIILSTVALLLGVRSIIYLHKDKNVRLAALAVRNDIVDTLASSTALGQVIAFLSTAPGTLPKTSFLRQLTRITQPIDTHTVSADENGKYGAWSRFITPKRASQKSLQREAEKQTNAQIATESLTGESPAISIVAETSLSLLLIWGSHFEDIASQGSADENFIICSPYNLLLSKVPSTSSHNGTPLNISNLNIISHFVEVGHETYLSNLSAKIIQMCVRQASSAAQYSGEDQIAQAGIPAALAGGAQFFSQAITRLLENIFDKELFFEGMEKLSALAIINLETIAIGISQQPELARSILSEKKGVKNFKLIDTLKGGIDATVSALNTLNQGGTYDNKVLRLQSAVAVCCLEVIISLWKSCRLGANKTEYHSCGGIVGHLTTDDNDDRMIADIVVDLARSTLLALIRHDEKYSMQDDVLISSVGEKTILIGLLSRSLQFLTIETVARVQTHADGFKFIVELIDPHPVKCWISILSSNRAPILAASVWKDNKFAKNTEAFLRACPPDTPHGVVPFSFDLVTRLVKETSEEGREDQINAMAEWSIFYSLAVTESSYAIEFAEFFEVINLAREELAQDIPSISQSLLDGVLDALSSISECELTAQSLLFADSITNQTLKLFEDLGSLLLTLLTTDSQSLNLDGESFLEMLYKLSESSSRVFVLTQICSRNSMIETCSIRKNLLASALIMLTSYQNLPKQTRSRSEVMRHNEIRLAWLDISLNAIQSLQFSESDSNIPITDATQSQSQLFYNFGSKTDPNNKPKSPFDLLCTTFSILLILAPKCDDTIDNGDASIESLSYTYSGDFVTCMKQRHGMASIQKHLSEASAVASLTYRAVYSSSTVTPEVSLIHTNAMSIIDKITTFTLILADASSSVVDILQLLMEARCLRSYLDNPLMKLCKMWIRPTQDFTKNALPHTLLPRGYVPAASGHQKLSYQNDVVHTLWCKVIDVFSSLLRSTKLQTTIYADVDYNIDQQLLLIARASLDFISFFEDIIFSCFSSISVAGKKSAAEKKSQASSTITTSSFAFSRNGLKEASCIVNLFEELCIGEAKNIALSYEHILQKMTPMMLDLTKILASFLGSIGCARELFSALSSASSLSYDQHASILDSHPLLADGIPNARHESIKNSHFASSCCVIVTSDDYMKSHSPTRDVLKPSEEEKSREKNIEQTFQIQVNNEFIDELEFIAGRCIFSVFSVLTNIHPASDAFVVFTPEEISNLDVAAVLRPGTCVSVSKTSAVSNYFGFSRANPVEHGYCKGCNRSTRTAVVEFVNTTGTVEKHVPWSQISGMEDTSRRRNILAHHTLKSASDLDSNEPASIGHLILALRWSRHVPKDSSLFSLATRVANRAAVLLSTEVVLHDELNKLGTIDEERKLNAQLLNLFEETHDAAPEHITKLTVDKEILSSVRVQLRNRLSAASSERDEEQKLWDQQNAGWDAGYWGDSHKREGRRSPFRIFNRASSMDSLQ